MKYKISITVFATIMLLTFSNNGTAQTQTNVSRSIEVIQFHSEHRCQTCLKIEELTKETLKSYPEIIFRLINVDDKQNEKIAEQFEATGPALFLYNPTTKKKKELTDFAFMNANADKARFTGGLKKEIEAFK
jgi:hypothetical protein